MAVFNGLLYSDGVALHLLAAIASLTFTVTMNNVDLSKELTQLQNRIRAIEHRLDCGDERSHDYLSVGLEQKIKLLHGGMHTLGVRVNDMELEVHREMARLEGMINGLEQ